MKELTADQRQRLREGSDAAARHETDRRRWQIAMRMVKSLGMPVERIPDLALAFGEAEKDFAWEGTVSFSAYADEHFPLRALEPDLP